MGMSNMLAVGFSSSLLWILSFQSEAGFPSNPISLTLRIFFKLFLFKSGLMKIITKLKKEHKVYMKTNG